MEYNHVGHAVPPIETSDLDQVLSRKGPRWRRGPPLGALIAGRASPCSPLPDPAISALGRARVVSLRGVLFSFFLSKHPNFLLVRKDTSSQSDM